ncbi:MAG: hypothetical protein RLZZ241_1341 [Bacteroidota bacterium]|jgi:homoserine kinase
MNGKAIQVFAPATIANLSCGFDILGLALEGVGDYMRVELTDDFSGVRIGKVIGMQLPLEANQNVAGVAAMALLNAGSFSCGVIIDIDKRIKPGSGIGSSAASAAGAVWGLNELLGRPFSASRLVEFAMQGEALASGVPHADNVAPALLGGIALVRSTNPLDVVRIPCPEALHACVLHPQIELKTSDARKILKTQIPLQLGIRQWGNVGGLISGFFTNDYELIGRSLEDCIIEPIRSLLIPGFDGLREAAMGAGALGFGISGSGPSVYALTHGPETAGAVKHALEQTYTSLGIPFEIHLSNISKTGVGPANSISE